MANVTIIARADLTGLGVQSRNWVRLLKPNKVIILDSTPFNNNEQFFEWYRDYNRKVIDRINPQYYDDILKFTDVVLMFETPYNYGLIEAARARGVKTVLQNNWEFTDYLRNPSLPLPDLLVNHSYWHLDEQEKMFPDITDYCPTPLFIDDFAPNVKQNFDRKGVRRFLHVAGRSTYEDRNGTKDLLEAVKLIPADVPFQLTIKTQTVPVEPINDPRVIIDTHSPFDERHLYFDFDAMILPRRYAGACLPMNEALASGLPVIMPNIDPNNKILPNYWLIGAEKTSSFMARTNVTVYSTNPAELANKIKEMALVDDRFLSAWKTEARLIAKREYAHNIVWDKWEKMLKRIGVQ
jgi:glycosyltransferase involved in cell wall biosynthesis